MINNDELLSFDAYFASIVSINQHPGSGTREHKKLSLEECAAMALEMLEIRRWLLTSPEAKTTVLHPTL